jgi:hypothetical protein
MSLRRKLNKLFPAKGLELPEDNKVVSFRLPGPLARTVSLLAVERGLTQSALIRRVLEAHVSQQGVGGHTDDMVRHWIAQRAYQEWYRMFYDRVATDYPGWRLPSQVESQFQKYLFQLDKMLHRRHLHPDDVDVIVDTVAQMWREEDHGTPTHHQ